jgi:ethanolamine utilization protein EutQ (cupin superfamily)
MAEIINEPSIIKASGNKEKTIEEFIGRINSHTDKLSIARMKSPEGWNESGQIPEFDEYTIVLTGCLCVETKDKVLSINAGQAIIATKGEWIKYSTPFSGGAEYIAVCTPAFSPDIVNRDE